MAEKFTLSLLRNLKPRAKPYEVRSSDPRGLLVRVQPTGKRTFYFEHERGKRTKVEKDGDLMIQNWTLGQIKQAAAAVQAAGPKTSRKEEQSTTLGGFVHGEYADFIADKVLTHTQHINSIERNFGNLYKRRMDEIVPLDIERWKRSRMKPGKKAVKFETVQRDYACLRACLNTAMQTFRYIGSHQLLNYRLEPPTALTEPEQKKVRYLFPAEEKRLREALDEREARIWSERELEQEGYGDHIKPLVLLALNTGLRRGDLFTLEWRNIDLSRRVITKVIRKTRRHRSRHVTLPLSKEARAILKEWKKQSDGDLLFPSPVTGGVLDNIDSAWGKVLKDSKIKNFRFHDLRHTFATRLVSADVPLITVRDLMTHSDISQTQIYAHVTDDALKQAVKRLDAS